MKMNLKSMKLLNCFVSVFLLFAMISCNLSYIPSFKASITNSEMKPTVAKVIDAQLDCIKEYLDDDLKQSLDGVDASKALESLGNSKDVSNRPLTGSDIVELTLKEEGGKDYLDFCYAVDCSKQNLDVAPIMDTAKYVLSSEEYANLKEQTDSLEESMTTKGIEFAKGLPLSQQEAFYKDLKVLVTRAVVLMVAGIVYACVPSLVFWGKVSAAAAIAVGAGLVAISIMSIYEYYKYGTGEGVDFETWFKDLIKIPKADFALTTTVTAMAEALGMGPVVTGIVLCVFGIYNIVGMVRTMLKTYNFDA